MDARQTVTDRHQLQQIVAGLTEGVILIDGNQDIIWANDAALLMHGVKTLPDLGVTVDHYRARFRLRYRNNHKLSKEDYPLERIIAGEAFRDVVVEVTPPGAEEPRWVHRVRSLVLTHATGEPDCLVLILSDVTERFEAEERFETSFNVNPAPAVICRLADMLYIKVNRGFLHLADLRRDQVVGRHFSEIDLFAKADKREEALTLVAEGRPVPQWESCLAAASGEKAVIVAGQPIEIDDKPCMMFTFMDLEPRRAAELALKESREQSRADFEALYTETPVALHSLDAAGRIVTVSNRWLELTQFNREDVIGRLFTDFLTLASASRYRDITAGHPSGADLPGDQEYQILTKTKVKADVLVSTRTTLDRQGVFTRTTAVLTDVTEKKHSEERFATAFSLAPVPMMLSSVVSSEVIDANQAFLTMIRLQRGDVVGHSIASLRMWPDDPESVKFNELLHRQAGVRGLDIAVRVADGNTIDCLISAELVNLLGQRCALVVIQDITDRRRTEAQLFEALETVMRDTSWFSRSVIEKLAHLRQPGIVKGKGAALDDLTVREAEILAHLSVGHKDDEIGTALGLTRNTVRNHVAAIYGKIGVHKRSNAIIWARERGLNGPEQLKRAR
ncbi:PAS domain S-box protein (plasmid) [Lichenicola cladoniae]|uniref:PAS domain S-box protein n=1 Tax=Lichenicola cladoniae TaxID=1484109 RepID=A0A6M8HYN1_9PROT|nr:PAS domain-containing protein [Lichenicola cladoniae]NPD69567.1 PAS domain S-box protein [Acetobacteraceae bacterium]QKE93448.1 PAS domain S-box protein [Lichenicola cladoniae]